ncbi:MAG: TonB-dependent receptor [Calditrichaceae bacterium]|nr:TonB-dependent receptor [Calditrichia bacterium]NUQ41854.1 TonB-dependent receptor [Calditrichaceae bacterium]
MHVSRYGLILSVLLLLNLAPAFAGTTGKIIGTVKDKSTGESLIGANVMLEGTSLGSSTDQDGFYVILNVPPGTYQLAAHYIGYAPITIENVKVSVDRTTTLNITMSSQAVEGQTVVIEARRPIVELDRTHSAAVVSAETVEMMPVTEVEEVIALQPGVVSAGGQLHFRGGRAREVTYVIDGVPVSNPYSQNGGSNVNVETNMIQELEVISGTFNAEYGAAQSGVVNIVTKRPSQTFDGNVQFYAGDWLSAQNDVFIGVSNFDPLAEKDLQFSLTGPIFSNKLGFYVSGRFNEWQSLDWYERRYNLLDGWRIAAYTQWVQHYGGGSSQGFITIPDSLKTGDRSQGPLTTGISNSLNAKLIYSPHPNVSLTYQAFGSYDEYNGPQDPDRAGLDQFRRYQPDGSGKSRIWEHSHFFRFQHSLSERFFYNLSASFQHNDGERYFYKDNLVAAAPGQPGIQPITSFSQGFSLGATDGFYAGKDGKGFRDQYLLTADLNWLIHKSHFIKAGMELKKHFINVYGRGFRATTEWTNNSFPTNPQQLFGPSLTFEEYWTNLIDYWNNWEDIYGTTRFVAAADSEANLYRDFNIEPLELAVYVQDKVELNNVIINAGVRLDLFQPNESVPINYRTESFNLGIDANLQDATVKYQLSPRLGISFPISSRGHFHAAYGHFFQMPSFQRMYNEPLVTVSKFQLEGRTLGNADLEAEKTIAYEIGLQQGITDDIAVDVTAYYKDFENLLGIEELKTIDNVTYRRYVNRDYGNSRGVTFGITKRSGFINGGLNYTLSFANGSSSSPEALQLIYTSTQIGGEPVAFADRQINSLDWDQRHTVNAFVNFVQERNWSVGLVGWLNAGTPFTPDLFANPELNDLEYKNAALKPMRWNVDLKAKKDLRFFNLQTILFLKIDNLFDHLNQEDVYPSTGRADRNAMRPSEMALYLERLEKEGHFTYEEVTLNPDFFSTPRKIELGMEVKF